MNERIKDLYYKVTKESQPGDDIIAKFTELIVRECQFAIVSRTDLPKHERKLYNNVLKEYFGVEE